jgi:hypothetical protein
MWFVVLLEDMLFAELAKVEDRLFVELAKVEDGWWWHSGRIGSKLELGHGCFGMSMAETAKDRMGNIAGGEGSTALYGWLPSTSIAAKVGSALDPFSF